MRSLWKKQVRYLYSFGLLSIILCCPLVITYFSHFFLCNLLYQRVSDFTVPYNHPESLFKFILGCPSLEFLPQQVWGGAWGFVFLTNSQLGCCCWAGSHIILQYGWRLVCFPLPRVSENNSVISKYSHNVLSSLYHVIFQCSICTFKILEVLSLAFYIHITSNLADHLPIF